MDENNERTITLQEEVEVIQKQKKNIPVKLAASLMGKSEQYVRCGLRNNKLPFGSAVKMSKKWTYYISPILFYEHIGFTQKNVQRQTDYSINGRSN